MINILIVKNVNEALPKIIENGSINYGVTLSIQDGLAILVAATISGLIIRAIFWRFGNSFSSRNGFGNTILLVTVSVAALIAVVKSSLALSLGLVGALSVVRFRTAVKEPYNLAFILLSVCVGIAIGASQFSFAVLVLLFGSVSAFLVYRRSSDSSTIKSSELGVDTISISMGSDSNLSEIYEILEIYVNSYSLRSLNNLKNQTINVVLNINIDTHQDLDRLIKELRTKINPDNITFYSSPT